MLINVSNHPYRKWSDQQRAMGEEQFGTIIDESFPAVHPADSLDTVAELVMKKVQDCLKHKRNDELFAIHIMGEFTFTYLFVKEMEKRGIPCVASTTERKVKDNPDGTKMSEFRSVQFREYFGI